MGNIKTTFIKRIARTLMEDNKGKFSKDYNKNKEAMKGLIYVKSKVMRNKIAGCISKKM